MIGERGFEPTADHQRVVAIDGPAAAGKSTVAQLLASRLGAMLFDTGALYRAVALAALRGKIAETDASALAELARRTRIDVKSPTQCDGRLYDVWLDGDDVTWAIRDQDVGAVVSRVSEHRDVRAALLPLQRRIAASGAIVMVGRDIGTVVVPGAGLKIFLDATTEERARRRFREIVARRGTQTFAQVLAETQQRDATDSERDAAPMRAANDAIRIETDGKSIDAVVATIESLARQEHYPDGTPVWPP